MALVHAKPKFWTREEYYHLVEIGALGEDEHVELIEGAIVPMPPQGPQHSFSISEQNTRWVRQYGDTHRIRVQLPLDLGNSQPEPDFAIVKIADNGDGTRHPSTADLVVEIARSSLSYDRNEKASVYAKAGIPEFWILNFPGRQVEVHRRPGIMEEGSFGYGYASVEIFRGDERFSPLFSPETSYTAADLIY